MRFGILFLSCLFLGMPDIALTASYYIDANSGDDTAPGSIQRPWKSFRNIGKATIAEGDTVNLKRGSVWRQTLEIYGLDGGKQKIAFRPYPDDKSLPVPVISCADDFSGQLWPGVLANGGFENSAPSACSDSTPGWKINLGEKASCQIAAATVRGQALKISNAGATTTIKSDNFPLLKPHNYQLTGTVDVAGDAVIQVYLRAYQQHGLTQIQHLDTGFAWVESKSPSNHPFLTLNRPGQHEINLRFKGIDTDSALLLFVVRGNATVNIDNIKLAREGVKEWSAALAKNGITPKILLINGQRTAKSDIAGNKLAWNTNKGASLQIVGASSIERESIEIGQRRTGIHLESSNNILIEDLTIRGCEEHYGQSTKQGAGILITGGSSNNVIRDITVKASDEGIRIEGDPAHPIQHNNNVITRVNIVDNISKGIAIRSYATGTVIRDCVVRNLARFPDDTIGQDIEGISIGGGAGEIYDTEVSGCSISSIAPNGKGPISGITVFNTDGTNIHNNVISDSGRNGIILANSSNSSVKFNGVHNTGLSPRGPVSAGIAVIADSRDVTKVSLINNTITGCHNSARFQGGITLLARACRGKSCLRAPKQKFYELSHVINMNNIIYGCSGEYPFALHAEHIDFDTLTSDHNLYFTENQNSILIVYRGAPYARDNKSQYSAWKSLPMHNADARNIDRSLESNSVSADPRFIAPEQNDFHLRSDSPARYTPKNSRSATIQMGAY